MSLPEVWGRELVSIPQIQCVECQEYNPFTGQLTELNEYYGPQIKCKKCQAEILPERKMNKKKKDVELRFIREVKSIKV